MSTLTREDLQEAAALLREYQQTGSDFKNPLVRCLELADALEAGSRALERERLHRGDIQAVREANARERDEAREALRLLIDAAQRHREAPDDLIAALKLSLDVVRAGDPLKGVERTHALVPLNELMWLNGGARAWTDYCGDVTATERATLDASDAAARGESPTWPETRA